MIGSAFSATEVAGRKLRGNPRRLSCAQTAKKSLLDWFECPYRKPTLVGTPKWEKVFEITLVKELGKLTP